MLHFLIITGEKNAGKTTFLTELIEKITQDVKNSQNSTDQFSISGFLAVGSPPPIIPSKNDPKPQESAKTAFILKDISFPPSKMTCPEAETLKSGKPIHICADNKMEDDWVEGPLLGRWFFNPRAMELGKSIITSNFESFCGNLQSKPNKKIIAIDEIGPLELKGGGWSEALKVCTDPENCSKSNVVLQIWTVRKNFLEKITSAFIQNSNDSINLKICDIADENHETERIYDWIKNLLFFENWKEEDKPKPRKNEVKINSM